MMRKLTLGALLIAVLALFAGACSSSDSDESSDTTEKKETTTTAGDEESDEVSDDEFDAAVSEVETALSEAGTEPCGIIEVFSGLGAFDLPQPSSPAQVESAIAVLTTMMNTIATSPAVSETDTETILAAVDAVTSEAEENDYSPEWFDSDETDPFNSDELAGAMESGITAIGTECGVPMDDGSGGAGGAMAPSTTVPAG